jgi:diguanylate cyclase (GGDEF)-like protein/PAS domain S-box-containing protein
MSKIVSMDKHLSLNAVIHLDNDGKITYASDGAGVIFGSLSAELIGKPVSVLLPKKLPRRVEREHAAAELVSTQIFLDAVVESIPSMVFVKDAIDGRFVLLNKAGEQLLGVSRHDLVGKSDFDLFSPDEAERFRQADRDVVALGELVTIENEPLSTPGGMRSLRTQKVGVPDADGNPRYLLGISEDVTERLKVEERNRHLSLHDILTDLPNRLSFQTLLDEQLIEPERPFALLLIDLDRFKAVNDSRGHHAGDELLRQLAARLLIAKNEGDTIARLGGDEFGILHLGEVNRASVEDLANRLVAAISEPFELDGRPVSIGCSIGVALCPDHGGSADGLMKRSDFALYAAKATGKGGFRIFETEMEENANRGRVMREELSNALEKSQFEVHYQPIIDTKSGKIVCCEALVRWRHPERGLVPPAEFIPMAEASGLIEPLGAWVLDRACEQASQWPDDIKLAVNLSPRQFTGFSLAANVMRSLERWRLLPSRLELEITESIFLNDSEENILLLNQLKQLGVRIALDDFGTGYSSLAYLRRFSFDKLKIDRSFISDLATSQESLAIVRAVIGLGNSFCATVTAEGVETHDQLAILGAEGCHQCQGYLFSRPVPSAQIDQLLATFAGGDASSVA